MIKTLAKALLLIILLANFALVPLAHADYTCSILNNPDEQSTEGVIVTILEEQIGKATSTADTGPGESTVLICMRETTCTTNTETGEVGCTSTYVVPGSCDPDISTCSRVQAFIAKSGAGLLYAYIGTIYQWAAGTIGVVCVLFMVVGGVQISIAGDNQGLVDDAKQRITQSIAGLVLLLLSAIILYTVNPNFFTL